MTSQRRVILEEVQRDESHPTADELYQRVRKRLPKISLGTVYRNLEVLAQNGLIRKMVGVGAQKRFDANLVHHYHIRCLRCGRIEDAQVEPIAAIGEMLHERTDYEILGHNLEFIGLCPSCRSQGLGEKSQKEVASRWS